MPDSEVISKGDGRSEIKAETIAGLHLTSTLPLRQMLEKSAKDTHLSEEMRQEAMSLLKEDKLSWRRVKPIYKAFREARQEGSLQLRDILKGSDIVREAPKPPVKSPELLARLEKLQRLEDDRQYKAMVHDITDHERQAEALRQGGLITYKDQMSYGVHIVVVMGVFYLMGHLASATISSKISVKAAGGLAGLVLAMLVEAVLLIIRTSDYGKPSLASRRRKGMTYYANTSGTENLRPVQQPSGSQANTSAAGQDSDLASGQRLLALKSQQSAEAKEEPKKDK